MNLTIDLNGHTIDRNLSSETSDGHVIYMDIYGSLTIMDTSEEKTDTLLYHFVEISSRGFGNNS